MLGGGDWALECLCSRLRCFGHRMGMLIDKPMGNIAQMRVAIMPL